MWLIEKIDQLLNNFTMYRVILYYLIFLLCWAFSLTFFDKFSFNSFELIFSATFLLALGFIVNSLFGIVFEAPVNFESNFISSLILALIITPPKTYHEIPFLFWAIILTMASKFILAVHQKHLFNPVALSVFITALTLGWSASWWVGTAPMFPAVLIGGLLVIRKVNRIGMVTTFFCGFLVINTILNIMGGVELLDNLRSVCLNSAIIFFGVVMLTEPLTMPPRQTLQLIYGFLVGILFTPKLHLGNFYMSPENVLIIGNVFSYAVSFKKRLTVGLIEKKQVALNTYDFIFSKKDQINFLPGQYVEWTEKDLLPDSRGNRRYFTIASSPTEDHLRIGVKFYPNSSSFKTKLANLPLNQTLEVSSLMGDFVMPTDSKKKLVFIAGGIGVTPFRSMIKYLIDKNDRRDIVLFYSCGHAEDVAYKEIFDEATVKLGIKVIYTLSDNKQVPPNWYGKIGFVDQKMIEENAPDYKERTFYISGPLAMANIFKKTLAKMGLRQNQIVTDYFPGF